MSKVALIGKDGGLARLVVTVGLPRSGKTTHLNKVYKPMGYTIVNPDSFRLAIHGQRFIGNAEPFVWAAVYAAVDALLLAGNLVAVDATHMTKKRRDPWEQRGAELILMGTTEAECIQRAEAINDTEIVPVIKRMAKECDLRLAIGLSERPTIKELEDILSEDDREVVILPDGSIATK